MAIKINVDAAFNDADVRAKALAIERQFNNMGQAVARASKQKFEPISIKSQRELEEFEKRMKSLLAIQGELARRLKVTGQEHLGPIGADFTKLYTNEATRVRKMQEVLQFMGGNFSGGHQPGPRAGMGSVAQAGVGAVQAGLRAASGATGGVGGVAAGALGTGMASGFGAGLMGLLGGVLALGVGKIVGAATEKIGQAEDNFVAYDKLKRMLGDVNVSFDTLRASIEGAASNVKVTFDEAAKLTTQFAKLGNVTNEQYKSMEDELRTGVGMARSLGLDPSQGMSFLGTMRGVRATRDADDSRRMALLIGETIAKSDAFAKSDEVMEAISNYVTAQTRASGTANVFGYAGMYSAMVGSGIAGLDPAGSAALLARINGTLAAGGGRGEASQFLSTILGAERGMDVFDTQLWREGGAFSTADKTFGPNSAVGQFYSKYGLKAPSGSETFFDATRSGIMARYGNNPKMMLMALANHLGISMSQAAMIEGLSANQMGDLEASLAGSGLKIGDINIKGLAAMAKVVSGSADERMSIAKDLWNRTGTDKLSSEEASALDKAMRSGSEQEQRDILLKLLASRDQEASMGKDIRDSKTALDNIKTSIAGELVPINQAMRDGIMYLAGGKDGKSSRQIREEMIRADIEDKYSGPIEKARAARKEAEKKRNQFRHWGPMGEIFTGSTEEELALDAEIAESIKKVQELQAKKKAEIDKALAEINQSSTTETPSTAGNPTIPQGWRAHAGRRVTGAAPAAAMATNAELDAKLADAERRTGLPPGTLKAVMMQETGGNKAYIEDPAKYHYPLDASGRRIAPHTGRVSTAFGPFGILESTARKPGYGVAPLKDKSIDEQIRFAADYLAARAKSAGSLYGGLAGYGEGYGYANSVMRKIGNTPMPEEAVAAEKRAKAAEHVFRMYADPMEIYLKNDSGPVGSVMLQPRFYAPGQPFRFN